MSITVVNHLKTRILNNQTRNLILCANFSRRSDAKNDDFYKVVKSKVRIEDETGYLAGEFGPNWELFAPRSNRFYLPGSLGLAWQNAGTIISVETPLDVLIDFESKSADRLHISTRVCPLLLRKNLAEIFPTPEVANSNETLTLITLSSKYSKEVENGAKNFVLASKEICSRLRLKGYWADFMNPFSGKPFHSFSGGKNLYKLDERFRGLGIKIVKKNDCMVISPEKKINFTGNVFTNAPSDLLLLEGIIMEYD